MSEVSVVSDSLRPHGPQQDSNLGPHDGERVESYPLNHQGLPRFSFFLIVPNREVSIFSCRVDSNVLGFMSLVVSIAAPHSCRCCTKAARVKIL